MSFAEAARVIVAELAEVSGDLLDVGLDHGAIADKTAQERGGGSLTTMMRATKDFLVASTSALDAQAELDDPLATDWIAARTPRGARPSHHPADFGLTEGGDVVPIRWLRPVPRLGADTGALAWLLHAHLDIVDHLNRRADRLRREVEAASRTRDSGTVFGDDDLALLSSMDERLQGALREVIKSTHVVAGKLPGQRRPASRLPPARAHEAQWRLLQLLHARVTSAPQSLPRLAAELLTEPVEVADYPFLYQRWCALQVLRALDDAGGVWRTDIVAALYLGGAITVAFDGFDVEVWIEPRIGRDEHPSGWRARSGIEAHPDILLTVPGRHGRDAFVLDPTLSTSAAPDKGKYLHVLEALKPDFVAGVYCVRRPRRSWAIIPDRRSACQLEEPFDGSVGVVPLHPLAPRRSAVRAWVDDVVEHGAMWGARATAGTERHALDPGRDGGRLGAQVARSDA